MKHPVYAPEHSLSRICKDKLIMLDQQKLKTFILNNINPDARNIVRVVQCTSLCTFLEFEYTYSDLFNRLLLLSWVLFEIFASNLTRIHGKKAFIIEEISLDRYLRKRNTV